MDERDLSDLRECFICGAAVAQPSRHREWHEKRGEKEEPREPGQVWTL